MSTVCFDIKKEAIRNNDCDSLLIFVWETKNKII